MSRPPETRGHCADLPPQVVDKFFYADLRTERFQHRIGRVICSQCPVQAACLEEAIVEPPGYGMRGGESSYSLWQLHTRWMDEHVDADVLAAEAIGRQTGLTGLQQAARAQKGCMPAVPLAMPELGGVYEY